MNFIASTTSSFFPRRTCIHTANLHRVFGTTTRRYSVPSPRFCRRSSVHLRCLCSSNTVQNHNHRRRNVGVPKNVQVDPVPRQLTPDETPWEDYLIPELSGNEKPRDPSRFTNDKDFVVLGIESSCDDTAAAVVKSDGTILGHAIVSQHELTESWGGVVPHVARDAHEQAISSVIADALEQAKLTEMDLNAVAATMGPGLEVCLRVGYRAARAVARRIDCDFVAVNHLEAHLLVPRMPSSLSSSSTSVNGTTDFTVEQEQNIEFPFLTLLVSGGHCQLLLVSGIAKYEVVGGTLDDALGEAYDKTARLLGLEVGGGGGPALEKLALKGNPEAIPFPVPMAKRPDCNFSFAGLKTCVRLAIDKLGGEAAVQSDRAIAADIAASFQETAVRHLEQRLRRAFKVCAARAPHLNTLVVSGGVAANQTVRTRVSKLCEDNGWRFVAPPLKLCTDNGVMVAWAGIERLRVGIADDTNHLDVRARWPLAGFGDLAAPLSKEEKKNIKEAPMK